jgi:hypothetical protein
LGVVAVVIRPRESVVRAMSSCHASGSVALEVPAVLALAAAGVPELDDRAVDHRDGLAPLDLLERRGPVGHQLRGEQGRAGLAVAAALDGLAGDELADGPHGVGELRGHPPQPDAGATELEPDIGGLLG